MKKMILGLFVLVSLSALPALADIQGAPFTPEADRRFDAIEQGNHYKYNSYPQGSADGHWAGQVAQASYNFSTLTGQTGTYNLGVSLPNNAIITQSWIYSTIKPTTSAGGTLAFKCQNTSDILAATAAASFASAGASIDGVSTGAAANFKYMTAKCNLQAVIATGALTAGNVTAYVEYVVHK